MQPVSRHIPRRRRSFWREYCFTTPPTCWIRPPRPELVGLDELKDAADAFIFDQTRATGGEHYQSRLIKIEGVHFVDADGWGPNAELAITDGVKTLPLKLGRGNGIYAGSNNLTEPFDVIGIMDQENTNLKGGYRL